MFKDSIQYNDVKFLGPSEQLIEAGGSFEKFDLVCKPIFK
jgi:hypothetical protein